MRFKSLIIASSMVSLAAAPVAAQSAAPTRSSEPTAEASELGGDSDIMKALIIFLIAGVGMAALLISDNDSTSP